MHVETVGTDSRSLPPACLFVALRGDRFDGHAFVPAAIQGGARAIVIDEAGAAALGDLSVPVIVVRDTLRALGDIAAWTRLEHKRPLVAITGSNGKTTTKELCAAALDTRGPVHRTRGNFNNLIGLPLTLLDWDAAAWAGVAEMGMNAPGEIARLTEIATPDVGVVTNAAAAHLEGLGTVDAVAVAKAELYAGLADGATAVINDDDPRVCAVADRFLMGQRRLRFGRSEHCDVRVTSAVQGEQGLDLELIIAGTPVTTSLGVFGTHNASNAAAAAAAALALGLDAQDIAEGLRHARVPSGRMCMTVGRTPRCRIIDDTYNANPHSMAAAFVTLAELAGNARRVAILGDMFELGADASSMHRAVGVAAAESGIDLLLALGQFAGDLAEGFGGKSQAHDTIESLLASLDEIEDGDWVLVKGSRGMRMERVVAHLSDVQRATGTN